jgi:hypothetical protein
LFVVARLLESLLSHAEALALGRDDGGVVSEPIEQGGGELLVAAEELDPFGEGEIGGDDDLYKALRSRAPAEVENMTMAGVFALANAHANVIRLCCQICTALDGDIGPLSKLKLRSSTPFGYLVDQMAAETTTVEDAARYIAERRGGG